MKLTNLQILDSANALQILEKQKFPVKLSWKISTALGALTPFAEKTNKFINEVQMKYAERDEKGELIQGTDEKGELSPNTFKITIENIEKANKEITDLLLETVEVSNVEMSLDDFPETFEVEPQIMKNLSPLFETK